MILKTRMLGQTYEFKDVKDVLAKASEKKSGDELAGVGAESALERIAAKEVLAQLTVADLTEHPVVPYEEDAVTRIIQDDIDEGADIIIIKPALAFLDILKTASWETDMTLCAYNVSGEYSMVKAAAANGWIDEKKIVMENMIGMKRAGAQMIITYHALDVANWLKEE